MIRSATLGWYLTRLFLGRATAVLLGLAALLLLLDLLDKASDILGHGGIADVGRYTLLRLPTVIGRLVPLAVLVGAVLTFRRLAALQEMSAIWATGSGPRRVLALLMPACALAAALQYALLLGLAPRTERSWLDWWDSQQGTEPMTPLSRRLWLREGTDIVAVDAVSRDGRMLEGVLLVRRDEAGQATARIDARRAVHDAAGWRLEDVRLARPGGTGTTAIATLPWPEGPPPASMRALARPTETQPLRWLLAGYRGEGPLTRGPAFFATRLQALVAAALEPAIMMLLALPTAFALPRQGGGFRRAATGLALGLGLLVVSGLVSSIGEAGRLDPVLAVWIVPACFALAGLAYLWRAEA